MFVSLLFGRLIANFTEVFGLKTHFCLTNAPKSFLCTAINSTDSLVHLWVVARASSSLWERTCCDPRHSYDVRFITLILVRTRGRFLPIFPAPLSPCQPPIHLRQSSTHPRTIIHTPAPEHTRKHTPRAQHREPEVMPIRPLYDQQPFPRTFERRRADAWWRLLWLQRCILASSTGPRE